MQFHYFSTNYFFETTNFIYSFSFSFKLTKTYSRSTIYFRSPITRNTTTNLNTIIRRATTRTITGKPIVDLILDWTFTKIWSMSFESLISILTLKIWLAANPITDMSRTDTIIRIITVITDSWISEPVCCRVVKWHPLLNLVVRFKLEWNKYFITIYLFYSIQHRI